LNLLVTTEKGILARIFDGRIQPFYQDTEPLMGIVNDTLVFGNKDAHIYDFRYKHPCWTQKYLGDVGFHNCAVIGEKIYLTATNYNEIWELNQNAEVLRKIRIRGPHGYNVSKSHNYNHINSLCSAGDHIYVCLNQSNGQYSSSGFAVFDREWREVDRVLDHGWEAHDIQFINKGLAILVAKSINNSNHSKAGLMVLKNLVYEIPTDWFPKALTQDRDYIYIGSGSVSERDGRRYGKGRLDILNKNDYSVVDVWEGLDIGPIRGLKNVS